MNRKMSRSANGIRPGTTAAEVQAIINICVEVNPAVSITDALKYLNLFLCARLMTNEQFFVMKAAYTAAHVAGKLAEPAPGLVFCTTPDGTIFYG